jgi:hypothetical protein
MHPLHLALIGILFAACSGQSPPPATHAGEHDGKLFTIPESMHVEHAEIHAALVEATKEPGRVGEAARDLAETLHPHFVREEEIALPPLALLRPLSLGESSPAMREVLPMTDALRDELPRMLREHEAIATKARVLEQTAREEKNVKVEELAKELQRHARSEEELFYPAAILVGEVVKARTR